MTKLQYISRLLRILFQLGFLIIPIIHIIAWVFGPEIMLGGERAGISLFAFPRDISLTHALTIHTRIAGFLIGLLPTIVEMYLCYFLIKLFRCYESNEIFSLNVARYTRNIGIILLIQIVAEIIYLILIHLLLATTNNISINFSSVNFGSILLALFIILNSWIMIEGYKLREEQQLTI